MAVATTMNQALNRLYSTTMVAMRKDLAFEIATAKPTSMWMFNGGAVRYRSVGADYHCPVVIQDSTNVESHTEFGTYSATPEDGPDTARWDAATHEGITRAFIKLSKIEMEKNSSSELQVLNLMNTKKAIAAEAAAKEFTAQLFGDKTGASAGANDMYGFQQFIQTLTEAQQATANASIAGISQGSFENWRNRYGQITSFATNGLSTWRTVLFECSKNGTTRPDIMPTDEDVYFLYEDTLLPSEQDLDLTLADTGFESLMYRGVPVVIEDELAGTGRTYFLTTTGKRRPKKSSFSMKKEHFAVPGKNPKARGAESIPGVHLILVPNHDFNLEGPYDLGAQQAAVQWNIPFAGFPATRSLKRLGVTDFGGSAAS